MYRKDIGERDCRRERGRDEREGKRGKEKREKRKKKIKAVGEKWIGLRTYSLTYLT